MIKCCICSCVCDSKAVWSPGAERLRRQTKGPHDNGSKGVKQIYFDICHRSPRSAEPGGPCLKRQVARWRWLSISRRYLRRGRAGISESWPRGLLKTANFTSSCASMSGKLAKTSRARGRRSFSQRLCRRSQRSPPRQLRGKLPRKTQLGPPR